MGHPHADPAQTIIAMERSALDRWGGGDPSGFLEISAPMSCTSTLSWSGASMGVKR